jgi:hypothetical protein
MVRSSPYEKADDKPLSTGSLDVKKTNLHALQAVFAKKSVILLLDYYQDFNFN